MTVTTSVPAFARRGLLTVLCCLAMFLYAVYFAAMSILLPYLGTAFHLGPEVQGRLFPAQFAGFIPGVLLAGILSDRWGRKSILLVGISAFGLGLLLFGIAPGFGWGLLAAALIGGGGGAMETVVTALMADLFPERRVVMVNALQAVFGIGAAIGPFVAQYLLNAGTDWRTLYIGLAATNILLALILLPLTMPPVASVEEAIDFKALFAILRQPIFLMLCLAQIFYVGAEVGFSSWMPSYFRQLPGGGPFEGLVVTIFWITMTVGRVIVAPLSGRVPVPRLIQLLAFGGVLGTTLALISTTPLIVMGSVAIVGLCFSGIFGLILSEAGEVFPAATGSAFGGIVACAGIGGAVLPWIIGGLASTSVGWRGGLLLVPLASAGVGIIAVVLERRRKK